LLTVAVIGEEKLDTTAAELVREGRRFQRRISTAVGRSVRRVYFPTLLGMAPRYMPSGYTPVLVSDLRATTSVRFAGSSPGVSVKVSAPTGGPRGRAVRALERGELRAPSWPSGPRSTWRWHRQHIPAGFSSDPLKAVRPQIVREIDQELGAIKRDVEH
jgi:hypothetical protein